MAEFGGGLTGGMINPSLVRGAPNHYRGNGLGSLVRGGLSGAAGGFTSWGTTWLMEKFNEEFGDEGCDCR
jgi:hypothetical protein